MKIKWTAALAVLYICLLPWQNSMLFAQCPTPSEAESILNERKASMIEELIDALKQCSKNQDTVLSNAYHTLGVVYIQTDNLDSIKLAVNANQEALKIRNKIFAPDAFLIGKSHYNLGKAFLYSNNMKQAETHLKKALEVYEVNNNNEPYRYIDCAIDLATLYNMTADYDKGLNYYKIALQAALKDAQDDAETLAIIYLNYCNLLYQMKRYEDALQVADKAIVWSEKLDWPDFLGDAFLQKGNALLELFRYEKAKESFNQSLSIMTSIEDFDGIYYICNSLGVIYKREGNYPLAIEMHEKGMRIAEENEMQENLFLAIHNLGDIYMELEDFPKSLEYYQQAIIQSVPGFTQQTTSSYPDIAELQEVPEKSVLLEHLSRKALSWKRYAAKDNNQEYLVNALNHYRLASELIDMMRQEFTASGSKLHWLEEAHPLLENAIDVAIQLHELTGNPAYKEEVWAFMEKNKAVLLLESIHASKDLYFANIPDSLLQVQADLSEGISIRQRELLDLRKGSKTEKPDSLIAAKEEQLARVKINLSDLEVKLKEQFPVYKQAGQINTISLAEVRSHEIDESTCVLEFFVGDSTAYAIGITNEHFLIHTFSVSELLGFTDQLLDALNARKLQNAMTKEGFQQFSAASYAIYDLMVKDILEALPSEVDQLLIIPDDVISYIPFDILMQQDVGSGQVNYNPAYLSFLINDYTVSYAYSGTVLWDQLNTTDKPSSQLSFLGFAPGFGGEATASGTSRACNLNELSPLQHNDAEIHKIQSIIGGETQIGEKATKASFQALASQFDILHLATHACADPEVSAQNKIFFTDDYLYSHELDDLDIKAQMVVLSACETGIGEFKRGEGVMSLARGFAYSGTPSITMSLWSVNDASTARLMEYYYTHLKEGHPKDAALRMAKLAYIAEQEDFLQLHPFFWAAFVHYGDAGKIVHSTNWMWYLGAGFVILAFAVFFYIRKTRPTTQ